MIIETNSKMGDEFDVDDLLEAPYKVKNEPEDKERGENGDGGKRSRSRSLRKEDRDGERRRSRSRDRGERRRSRSRERGGTRDRSRERRRSRSRDRRRRSRSRDRGSKRRSRSRDRYRRSRSRDRREDRGGSRGGRDDRGRDRSRDRRVEARLGSPPRRGGGPRGPISPIRGMGNVHSEFHIRNIRSTSPDMPLTPEERDARTIFCMQLSQRCRARDVEDFFSSVGKVRDVKLIVCNKTRRFKGIAYVEFKDLESVPLALGLSGQKLVGVPVVVQPSQAEKNRVGNYSDPMVRPEKGPMKLYIGSLHFNITEDMLKGIFEPFGRIHSIQLMKDPETDRSKGYGFITYNEAEDAKKAMEHLNGFELAGRAMKVGHVTEHAPIGPGFLDQDDERAGFDLGATGRLALMAKLAEGTGMKVPDQARAALMGGQQEPAPPPQRVNVARRQEREENMPPIATQCFMLSNMFDPINEREPAWDQEIRDDVVEECNKHGGVVHIYVDKASPQGNVYVKCPSINCAVAAVNALHGRWFAGKVITAAYVPVVNYHNLFPDSVNPTTLIQLRR